MANPKDNHPPKDQTGMEAEGVRAMNSPDGLDIHPEPRKSVRISRRARRLPNSNRRTLGLPTSHSRHAARIHRPVNRIASIPKPGNHATDFRRSGSWSGRHHHRHRVRCHRFRS